MNQKSKQNGKQSRSKWDGSLRAVSSGSTLFAYVSGLVYRAERVRVEYLMLVPGYLLIILHKSIFCRFWFETSPNHYKNMPIQIYWNFYHQKNENLQIKNSDNFHISAQNIDCGYSLEPPRRGGSNEYPQSIFLSRNKKNNIYPCKPQFYYIKMGFKGVKII